MSMSVSVSRKTSWGAASSPSLSSAMSQYESPATTTWEGIASLGGSATGEVAVGATMSTTSPGWSIAGWA